MKEIKIHDRKSAYASLEDFCIFSMGDRKDKEDFIEVTEWSNWEGYDIRIHDIDGEKSFHMTVGQVEAFLKCIEKLN